MGVKAIGLYNQVSFIRENGKYGLKTHNKANAIGLMTAINQATNKMKKGKILNALFLIALLRPL